jgi:hypothetical protein
LLFWCIFSTTQDHTKFKTVYRLCVTATVSQTSKWHILLSYVHPKKT